MRRIATRDLIAVALIALVCGLIPATPLTDGLRGLSIDILTALRTQAAAFRKPAADTPVVVVAIDEETYRTPPFKGSPTLTWTGEIGRVLNAVIAGGASVVGFDIVFPTSIEQSEIPFGDDAVGARMRGFDRDFLRALAGGAAAGKVVLGEVLGGGDTISPSPGQQIAVRRGLNIRPLNVYVDPDDVVRRVPLSFPTDGKPVPSMAVELVSRALQSRPQIASDGRMTLAGYRIPGAVPNTLTLNFEGGADDIPTYSFADLRACAVNDDADFFQRQFAGKVVLFGTLLDGEDRKLTSKRFATGYERAQAPRCVEPVAAGGARFRRNSIAGVYIHATAIRNLIDHDGLVELRRPATALITIAVAALAALAAFVLPFSGALLACAAAALIWLGVAIAAFVSALVLPLAAPAIAGSLALVLTAGYRQAVSDRTERLLRKSFSLYLAPQVIERMLASNRLPVLGGETRHVTVFFSDLADFSSIAERMPAEALVALINDYLSAMTGIIEDCGGYVDKYIGDSVVAVFGAPADDPDHAASAVRAALLCHVRLDELNRDAASFQGLTISHRIGLNSGDALVGNIGSRKRFNYSVMSDAVNVASRLEGANKYYGTAIIASEATVALAGDGFAWRELDSIRVKGRSQPITIFEPLAETGRETADQRDMAARYRSALAHWRQRAFASVDSDLAGADGDPAAESLRQRARQCLAEPPGPDWEPVHNLDGK